MSVRWGNVSQGGHKTRETVTQPATEPSHQKPQQWHLSQVSCSSDLHVLQLCPISLASSNRVWPHHPSPILEMWRLRPTEEPRVTNSSLMPFPNQRAPCLPHPLPCLPRVTRNTCSLWSTSTHLLSIRRIDPCDYIRPAWIIQDSRLV